MKKKRTVKYTLMLLGLVIFLAGYFLFYLDYSDQTDTLTSEIKTLSARLDELEGYSQQLDDLQSGIDNDKASISDALQKYYTIETPEDFIMLATAMEDNIGVSILALSFEEPVLMMDIEAIDDAGDYVSPLTTRTLTGYNLTASLEGTMTYTEMKDALDYIYNQTDATSLNSVELNFDSTTGLLQSIFVIDKYYVTGRDLEEHQINVPYTDIGNDALMGG